MTQRLSTDLNRIYLVHWVIIMWIVDVVMRDLCGLNMSSLTLMLIAIVILVLSAIIARKGLISKIKL